MPKEKCKVESMKSLKSKIHLKNPRKNNSYKDGQRAYNLYAIGIFENES